MNEQPICRWGIMSTASIATKNWQAIKNSGNGQLVAVASRSGATAQSFIDQCQSTVPFAPAPKPVEGYQTLLERDDIDAVYIPLPTGLRKQWVIRAAQAGKHVMCEKPCANHVADLKEMTAACHNHGVQFMDGVMFMHSQRLSEMKKLLDDEKSVGEIRRIAAQFSFNGGADFEQENIRTHSELEPLGCLGDLGWYTVGISLWAMNFELPVSVTGRMLQGQKRADSPNAVPMEISSEMIFASGASATTYNSFVTSLEGWFRITGTLGSLVAADFVQPFAGDQTRFSVYNVASVHDGCDGRTIENRRDFAVDEAAHSGSDSQEANLFRKFAEIVNSGKLEPHWPETSMKTQTVVDAIYESANDGGRVIELSPD